MNKDWLIGFLEGEGNFNVILSKSYNYSRKKGIMSSDQFVFYVTSSKDLLKIKDIFQTGEFHTKKKKDMIYFFKILDLKLKSRHLTRESYDQIILLATSMNSENRGNWKSKEVKLLTE